MIDAVPSTSDAMPFAFIVDKTEISDHIMIIKLPWIPFNKVSTYPGLNTCWCSFFDMGWYINLKTAWMTQRGCRHCSHATKLNQAISFLPKAHRSTCYPKKHVLPYTHFLRHTSGSYHIGDISISRFTLLINIMMLSFSDYKSYNGILSRTHCTTTAYYNPLAIKLVHHHHHHDNLQLLISQLCILLMDRVPCLSNNMLLWRE